MSRIRAIILDFDGVIVDSNEVKSRAFEELFDRYPTHRNAALAFHRENFSRSRMVKIRHLVHSLMNRPEDEESVVRIAREYSELVATRVAACPEIPGAGAFLEEFSEQAPLYISSTTPQSELEGILSARGIRSHFTGVFGDPPHPKPEVIRHVLEKERLSRNELLFIGDAETDYRAARECGVEFIGRDSGLFGEGIDAPVYHDLFEIAKAIRPRVAGERKREHD